MRLRLLAIGVSTCVAVLASHDAAAQPFGFHFTGLPSGADLSEARGLSANGVIAAGRSSSQSAFVGFVWSADPGRTDLAPGVGVPNQNQAYAISGDGGTVVGWGPGIPGLGGRQAFRWSGPGTYQGLGVLSGYTSSIAYGVSADGSVVAGSSVTGSQDFSRQAFRWTPQGGLQGLGTTVGNPNSEATAVSGDGNVIVGYSAQPAATLGDAFRWTLANGMQALPQLPGTGDRNSRANGTNNDGSIIVGSSGNTTTPVKWVNSAVVNLGLPAGWTVGSAISVSDDGAVIAGGVGNGISGAAAVWTLARGPELLGNYLTALGVPLPSGLVLTACWAVSADGRTFAGSAYADGVPGPQGYVVTVPAPAASALLLGSAGFKIARRRRAT